MMARMRALTTQPGTPNTARLDEVPDPPAADGSVLVETVAIGICGTDHDILAGEYGWAPPGEERLTIGHESIGRVLEAPEGSGLAPGDLAVSIVRRPDPVPCLNCRVGEWDFCRNGKYTERGIKEHHGYASERYRVEPEYAVKVNPALGRLGVLLEPTSILAKAWEQIERISARALFRPQVAVVTGAGPVGLLAALLAVQRGLEVRVLDRVTDGPKPDLVAGLGATYHTGSLADLAEGADIVVECTGVGELVFDAMTSLSAGGGVVCLTGVSPEGRSLSVEAGSINRALVLGNNVVFGSVNANRRHYEAGATALAAADHDWLGGLVTREVALEDWRAGIEKRPDDVKVVVGFAD
jgi:glucose 1-dehydrogenase